MHISFAACKTTSFQTARDLNGAPWSIIFCIERNSFANFWPLKASRRIVLRKLSERVITVIVIVITHFLAPPHPSLLCVRKKKRAASRVQFGAATKVGDIGRDRNIGAGRGEGRRSHASYKERPKDYSCYSSGLNALRESQKKRVNERWWALGLRTRPRRNSFKLDVSLCKECAKKKNTSQGNCRLIAIVLQDEVIGPLCSHAVSYRLWCARHRLSRAPKRRQKRHGTGNGAPRRHSRCMSNHRPDYHSGTKITNLEMSCDRNTFTKM